MFDTDIVITNFTINNNIINTKSNMTYNTWTMKILIALSSQTVLLQNLQF